MGPDAVCKQLTADARRGTELRPASGHATEPTGEMLREGLPHA
jgi:hypothetical protein